MGARVAGRILFAMALSFAAVGAAAARESLAVLQARFDRETDSVRKAKLLPKLGDAQFDQAKREGEAGNYDAVTKLFESYRDNAHTALEGLKKTQPNAERHPAGFKQLQMHVLKAERILHETILGAPDAARPPLEQIRRELDTMEEELIRLLFPRRPGEKPVPKRSSPK
jgi:hypothetical protein